MHLGLNCTSKIKMNDHNKIMELSFLNVTNFQKNSTLQTKYTVQIFAVWYDAKYTQRDEIQAQSYQYLWKYYSPIS